MLVKCSNCGIEFNKKPVHIAKSKSGKHFCSTECSGKYKSKTSIVEVKCATCGKNIKRRQSEINKSKTGNLFCSHSCSAKMSNISRSENKYNYRNIAFRELPHKCDICGYDSIKGVLQVHHKDRIRTNNDISNLQILCPTCHSVEHYNKKDGLFHNLKSNDV